MIEINLMSCGLISRENKSLIEFIKLNRVTTVDEFISMMDNESYDKKRVYSDILLEAKGLADLLKYKYFNSSLMVDSYLCSNLKDATFKVYGSSFVYLAVSNSYNKKVVASSAITRIGFSDRERTLILNREHIRGRLLIDVLIDIYNDIVDSDNIKDNIEFINKLRIVIDYYNRKINKSNDDSNTVLTNIDELSDLMMKRTNLDRRTEEIYRQISQLENLLKGVKK